QDQTIHPAQVRGILTEPVKTVWSGVTFGKAQPLDTLWLWLATHLPNRLSRMPVQRTAIDTGLVTPGLPWGDMAAVPVGERGLAYLTMRPDPRSAGRGHGRAGPWMGPAPPRRPRLHTVLHTWKWRLHPHAHASGPAPTALHPRRHMGACPVNPDRWFPLVLRKRPPAEPIGTRVELVVRDAYLARESGGQEAANALARAFNGAALIVSDAHLPDLARLWCWKHAELHLDDLPLTGDHACRALEPVVNLARLEIRAGR